MLKRTNSNISYGYSKNTTNILINNIRDYAYLSEMTLVRPTNSGPYKNHGYHVIFEIELLLAML